VAQRGEVRDGLPHAVTVGEADRRDPPDAAVEHDQRGLRGDVPQLPLAHPR
jgi:hypothetical protein